MTESSLKKLTIKAVICTIISAKIIRHQTIRVSKLKAVMVEIMVIGFRIGAAKRKLITSAGLSPFAIKLRAIGTLPHSHTGKISPIIESAIRRRKVFFGNILKTSFDDKKYLINADMIIPKIKNGAASTITLSVSVMKSCNDGSNLLHHSANSPFNNITPNRELN